MNSRTKTKENEPMWDSFDLIRNVMVMYLLCTLWLTSDFVLLQLTLAVTFDVKSTYSTFYPPFLMIAS